MITPKQNAEELFNAMKGFRVKHSHIRKCAKVVCDVMIAELNTNFTPEKGALLHNSRVAHWTFVKLELDKCGKQ
jgi:hypothetical protein